ncbi:hypothetical protein dqs_2825 [Azoarcus olearius]|uniref:YcjF family protein n=1 Tax=Azoarcus sp. (strain BH72) TaxID=418699 RepID=UPI0008062D0A|nr:TerB family tellurite resistance protein [Azoarcus olearius]ANQ85853.1 hypothetical protein dqs_2825 [Azoarcus olearius]
MENEQTRAILAICLLAAFADNRKDALEREHIRRVAASLSRDAEIDLVSLYQDVLLQRVQLDDQTAALDTPELRHLAYEMAVGVCDADGVHDSAERAFLERLSAALQLAPDKAAHCIEEADALAAAPLATGPSSASGPSIGAAVSSPAPAVDEAELDRSILQAAILNGALELLPQSMASMAIIPLQTRLVYRIGKAYGYELDRGHINDFLATAGVGLTSQYVEQLGRKLIGGLLGKVLGGTGRSLGSAATGSAMSFASTYAIGQVAKRYYAGGRRLDTDALREAFSGLLGQGRALQQRYLPEIEQRAGGLDLGRLMTELRG